MELGAWSSIARLPKSNATVAGGAGRAAHTLTSYGKYIYLVGGRNASAFFGDFLRFDTEASAWERLPGLSIPARANHLAVLVAHELWILGGCDDAVLHGDAWVLDLRTNALTRAPVREHPSLLARAASAADVHPTQPSCILLFGGWGKQARTITPQGAAAASCPENEKAGCEQSEQEDVESYLNDVVMFDTVTHKASRLACQGPLPIPRGYHSFNAMGGRLFLFGGRCARGIVPRSEAVAMWDPTTSTWTKLAPRCVRAPPRAVLAAAAETYSTATAPSTAPKTVSSLHGAASLRASSAAAAPAAAPAAMSSAWAAVPAAGSLPVSWAAANWPRARASHRALVLGDRLLLQGGSIPASVPGPSAGNTLGDINRGKWHGGAAAIPTTSPNAEGRMGVIPGAASNAHGTAKESSNGELRTCDWLVLHAPSGRPDGMMAWEVPMQGHGGAGGGGALGPVGCAAHALALMPAQHTATAATRPTHRNDSSNASSVAKNILKHAQLVLVGGYLGSKRYGDVLWQLDVRYSQACSGMNSSMSVAAPFVPPQRLLVHPQAKLLPITHDQDHPKLQVGTTSPDAAVPPVPHTHGVGWRGALGVLLKGQQANNAGAVAAGCTAGTLVAAAFADERSGTGEGGNWRQFGKAGGTPVSAAAAAHVQGCRTSPSKHTGAQAQQAGTPGQAQYHVQVSVLGVPGSEQAVLKPKRAKRGLLHDAEALQEASHVHRAKWPEGQQQQMQQQQAGPPVKRQRAATTTATSATATGNVARAGSSPPRTHTTGAHAIPALAAAGCTAGSKAAAAPHSPSPTAATPLHRMQGSMAPEHYQQILLPAAMPSPSAGELQAVAQVDLLTQQLAAAQAHMHKEASEAAALRANLQLAQQQVEEARQSQTALHSHCCALEVSLQAAQTRLTQAAAQASKQAQQRQQEQHQHQQAMSSMQSLQVAAEAREDAKLRQATERAERAAAAASAREASLLGEVLALKNKLQLLEGEFAACQSTRAGVEGQVLVLKEAAAAAEQALAAARAAAEEAGQARARTEGAMAQARDANRRLGEDLCALGAQMRALEGERNTLTTELQVLRAEMSSHADSASHALEEEQRAHAATQAQLKAVQASLAHAQADACTQAAAASETRRALEQAAAHGSELTRALRGEREQRAAGTQALESVLTSLPGMLSAAAASAAACMARDVDSRLQAVHAALRTTGRGIDTSAEAWPAAEQLPIPNAQLHMLTSSTSRGTSAYLHQAMQQLDVPHLAPAAEVAPTVLPSALPVQPITVVPATAIAAAAAVPTSQHVCRPAQFTAVIPPTTAAPGAVANTSADATGPTLPLPGHVLCTLALPTSVMTAQAAGAHVATGPAVDALPAASPAHLNAITPVPVSLPLHGAGGAAVSSLAPMPADVHANSPAPAAIPAAGQLSYPLNSLPAQLAAQGQALQTGARLQETHHAAPTVPHSLEHGA